MTLNPSAQYVDDSNLRARQRFWQYQSPPFDTAAAIDDEGAFTTSGDLAAFICQ